MCKAFEGLGEFLPLVDVIDIIILLIAVSCFQQPTEQYSWERKTIVLEKVSHW